MFREIRFQTGEVHEVAREMKSGAIPHLEVNFMEEFDVFVERLKEFGIFKTEGLPYDKSARDKISEPEFEFRAAFSGRAGTGSSTDPAGLMYIDVYFEEEPEESYDPIGEM